MACKPKRAFAGGGAVGADGLTDEQRAKLAGARASLGVSNNPPVTQPPAPAPQPAPQTQQPQGISSGLGIVGIFKNRGAQIDKAVAGYANGGRPGGGKIQGIGTPTSDSIPAKVQETGEPIKVSTTERILSAAQDAMLEDMARKSGFESLDAMLEAGTGKPVGPTIKGGKKAAAGGWALDNNPDGYAKAMQSARNNMAIPSMASNNDAANGGIYKEVGLPKMGIGAGQAPTIYDNGGLPTATDRVSGSLPVAKQPVATPGSSLFDKDPLTAMSSGIAKSMASSDAANTGLQNLYPAGTFDGTTAPQPDTAKTGAASSTQANNPVYAPSANRSGESNPNSTYGQGLVRATAGIGSFAQDGKTYNVAGTSQDNIKRVTGGDLTSPLYTNIDPAQGVAGLKNQTIGQPADQEAQGLARIANANKIRGEMIDSMVKANGGNGGGILGDLGGGMTQTDLDNAEKTRRWRNDELLAKANRGNQGAIAALLNTEGGRDVAAMGNETSRQNAGLAARVANNRDQVTMRGQDLNLQGDIARIAGNPLDNQTRQLSLTQAQRLGILQDSVLNGKTPEEQASAAAKIRALSGKQDREDRTVKPMEIADPNDPTGQRKILVRPNDDGTYTPMQPRRTYAEFAQAYLSKKPGTKPEQMKADYEQLYGGR